MTNRKILHLDLDAFFCAVEELRNPELRGQPFAVGGRPNERGVISSCSYPARLCGVHSAMPTARALKLCPNLILVIPQHHAYHDASVQVMEILNQLTPLVEQISIDEAFMDVSDLPQSGLELAKVLQASIFQKTGLPCSIGVATNKLVAKIATNIGKSTHRAPTPPRAILVVPPGEEAAFLAPLPVRELWGVGPKMSARLVELGITTIGELAKMPESWMVKQFGKWGYEMSQHARGIDDRPIELVREAKSISQEVTFDRDIADQKRLEDTLQELSTQVAYRLRQDGLTGGTVRIKLRWPDFSTHTRQITLQQATDQDGIIFSTARQLFHSLWQPGRAVRLLGVGVSGLSNTVYQLTLWEGSNEKERRLLAALDSLRQRYGEDAVQRGRTVRRKNNNLPTKSGR
jgi:DNA polymerase IV